MSSISQPRAITLYEAITRSGALGSLEFCCDQRDPRSWSGSGLLTDLSGKSVNFQQGETAGVDTNDGVYVGPVGSRRRLSKFTNAVGGRSCFTVTANTTFINSMHKPGAKWSWLQIGTYDVPRAGGVKFSNSESIELALNIHATDGSYAVPLLAVRNNAGLVDQQQSTLKSWVNNGPVLGNEDGYIFGGVALDAANNQVTWVCNDLMQTAAFNMAAATSADLINLFMISGNGTTGGGQGFNSFISNATFAAWSRLLSPNEWTRIFRMLLPNYKFTTQRIL